MCGAQRPTDVFDPCLASSRHITCSSHPCLRRRALPEPLDSARVSGRAANPLDKRSAITIPQRHNSSTESVSMCEKGPLRRGTFPSLFGMQKTDVRLRQMPAKCEITFTVNTNVKWFCLEDTNWCAPVSCSWWRLGSGTPTVSQNTFRGQSPKITRVISGEYCACMRLEPAVAPCMRLIVHTRHDPRMDFDACSGTFFSPTLLGGIFNGVLVSGVLRNDCRLNTCSQATTTARIAPDAQESTATIEKLCVTALYLHGTP